MKLIVLESGDRLGKNSIIEGLCGHFDHENVCVRHFGKPPSGMSPEETVDFQFKCFDNEATVYNAIKSVERTRYGYFKSTVIWNRSHLGEYVYGQLFRKEDPKILRDKIIFFERFSLNLFTSLDEVYLVTLTADPEFFHSREDGKSFSQTLEEKTRELELFREVHEISQIQNKLLLKVDEDGRFKSKEEILDAVINFVDGKV